jgi:hypothetical protein
MNAMIHLLDGTLVGLALLASVAYAAASFGPRSWRRAMLAGLAWAMARLPVFPGLRGLAGRLSLAASSAAKGSCGGCGTCAADAVPGTAAGADGNAARAAEVSVPLAKIGRRAFKAP